jgi:hypothetical protein
VVEPHRRDRVLAREAGEDHRSQGPDQADGDRRGRRAAADIQADVGHSPLRDLPDPLLDIFLVSDDRLRRPHSLGELQSRGVAGEARDDDLPRAGLSRNHGRRQALRAAALDDDVVTQRHVAAVAEPLDAVRQEGRGDGRARRDIRADPMDDRARGEVEILGHRAPEVGLDRRGRPGAVALPALAEAVFAGPAAPA